jgi:PmbA protein
VSGDAADLLGLAEKAVAEAGPGEAIEVFASRSRRTTVTVQGGKVEAVEQAASSGIGVRVVVDGRQGFAFTGVVDEASLAATLADARDNARFASPDDGNAIASPDGVPFTELPPPDEALGRITAAERISLAIELERVALAADPRMRGARSAEWMDLVGTTAVATSTGIRANETGSTWVASADVMAGDGDEVQAGWAVAVGRARDEVDVERVGREAAERATMLLGATQPASRRLPVVLDPHVVGSFLGLIGAMVSGDAVVKGRSLFADRLGQPVASPLLTLVDDPTDPRSNGASVHDGEGLACRRTPLVAGGELQGFLHATWSARRAGTASTGSARRDHTTTPSAGARALSLTPGATSADGLLALVGEGLYVTHLAGLHSGTNTVSGDFSVGVSGRMIRGGALAEPVREATIASTLQRMLLEVVAVGDDLLWLPGGAGAVSLAIDGVTLSGT